MGIFGRSRSPTEKYPPDRLSFLPMGIGAAFEECIRTADFDRDMAWGSRFFSGYLLGYPTYVDDVDERFGGAVRKLLFDSMFGPELGSQQFRAAMGHYLLNDEQTKRGWGAGVPDGERYFRAVENQEEAAGSTDSLALMFQISSVDLSQQTL